MGSWSVYCGISQIAITAGQECVLLPLKPRGMGEGYDKFIPATLPIYGMYNAYGEIEGVEMCQNVEMICDYFKCTIEEFTYLLQRRDIDSRDSDEYPNKQLYNNEELKGWTYMWIDRKVYDFLSTYVEEGYSAGGDLDWGKKEILELLGFTYVGETEDNPTYDPKRYKHSYRRGEQMVYSDGTWVQLEKGKPSLFRYKDMKKAFNLPDGFDWLNNMTKAKGWRLLSDSDAKRELLWIMGGRSSDDFDDRFEELMKSIREKMPEEERKKFDEEEAARKKPKTLLDIYKGMFKTFGDELANLINIRHHLNCMSGTWAPYILYMTPQCGEHEQHQVLLEKFAEINKSYCMDEEEDEDEEF
jgi:hypothetical protein